MKKLLLLIVLIAFSSITNAQTAATSATPKVVTTTKAVTPKTKQVANPAAFACMKCYNIEKDGGKCSKCQSDKVQLGTYYCEHCMKASGTKAGKCEMCSAKTTQMTRKFCASKNPKSAKETVAHKKAA